MAWTHFSNGDMNISSLHFSHFPIQIFDKIITRSVVQ